MLLLAPLALAGAPSLEELSAYGAAAVLRCDDVGAVLERLGPMTGAPGMLTRDMVGSLTMAGFGPGDPVMWLTPTTEAAKGQAVDPPRIGALPAQAGPRVIPAVTVARSASYGRGCVALTDIAGLRSLAPGGLASGTANITGQMTFFLPEAPGPLEFALTGSPPALPSAEAQNLDLSLMVARAPDAVVVADRFARSKNADPKLERQARQFNAAFPIDGVMVGLWFDNNAPRIAGAFSLERDIKAKATMRRLEAALRKGKLTYTRDGDVLSFTLGSALSALGGGDASGAGAEMLANTTLHLAARDGQMLIATTREALDALTAGGTAPFVSDAVKAQLAENDIVLSVRGFPEIFSNTEAPALMTMRSTAEGWAGTLAIPRGFLDTDRMKKGMGGQGKKAEPPEDPM